MRKTIFAKDMKTLRERLLENMYNGWKQVGAIRVVGKKYLVKVEKENVR